MELYLLKVKHVYDEEYEECGIFSSKVKMNYGRKVYLAMKKKAGLRVDKFTFTHTILKLDSLVEYANMNTCKNIDENGRCGLNPSATSSGKCEMPCSYYESKNNTRLS